MNTPYFAWIQQAPNHPILEWIGDKENWHFNELIDFLSYDKSLPEDMSLSLDGSLYHFGSKYERIQWVIGFLKMWEMLCNTSDIHGKKIQPPK